MVILIRLLYSHFVTSQILLLVIFAMLTVCCGRQPGVYAAPPQRSLDLGPDPDGPQAFVTMDEPVANDYLVRDISPERGFRRWAFTHPELRFRLQDVSHLIFTAEFAIPEVTYKVTGPVTVSYAVNGRNLGSLTLRSCRRFQAGKARPQWADRARQVRTGDL